MLAIGIREEKGGLDGSKLERENVRFRGFFNGKIPGNPNACKT